jgi:hypothetical protein
MVSEDSGHNAGLQGEEATETQTANQDESMVLSGRAGFMRGGGRVSIKGKQRSERRDWQNQGFRKV